MFSYEEVNVCVYSLNRYFIIKSKCVYTVQEVNVCVYSLNKCFHIKK